MSLPLPLPIIPCLCPCLLPQARMIILKQIYRPVNPLLSLPLGSILEFQEAERGLAAASPPASNCKPLQQPSPYSSWIYSSPNGHGPAHLLTFAQTGTTQPHSLSEVISKELSWVPHSFSQPLWSPALHWILASTRTPMLKSNPRSDGVWRWGPGGMMVME